MPVRCSLVLCAVAASATNEDSSETPFPVMHVLKATVEDAEGAGDNHSHRHELLALLTSWERRGERSKVLASIPQESKAIGAYILLEAGDAFSVLYNVCLVVDHERGSTVYSYRDAMRKRGLRSVDIRDVSLAADLLARFPAAWHTKSDASFQVIDGEGFFLTMYRRGRRHTVCAWGDIPEVYGFASSVRSRNHVKIHGD